MLKSPSRQLAFSQFQQGDSGDSNIFEHGAWEFGEERIEQVRFVTPDVVPVEICRAVRTNSHLAGAGPLCWRLKGRLISPVLYCVYIVYPVLGECC